MIGLIASKFLLADGKAGLAVVAAKPDPRAKAVPLNAPCSPVDNALSGENEHLAIRLVEDAAFSFLTVFKASVLERPVQNLGSYLTAREIVGGMGCSRGHRQDGKKERECVL